MMLVMWQTTFFVLSGLGFFENWLDIRKLNVVTEEVPPKENSPK